MLVGLLLVGCNYLFKWLNLNSFSFYIVLFFMYICGELGTILHNLDVINIVNDLDRRNNFTPCWM
jgi:hypothetical protein